MIKLSDICMTNNLKAFLDMIAISEGTARLGNNGYNVIVGGQLFKDYHDHPGVKVWIPRIKKYSSAAGRYQILHRYWDHYKKQLKLPDFSPDSQDKVAIQMIKEQKALKDIEEGRIEEAINKCANIWASLPGAGYNQHENSMEKLMIAYHNAGGGIG
jgi:muramidase (phage lysozyme)